MKNVGFVLIVLLAFVAIVFVSCNVEYYDPSSELVEVSFSTESSSKALTRTVDTFDNANLHWFYTAEKVSAQELSEGATTDEVYIGKGLANRVGPFSQGTWTFTLYGYKDVEVSAESETGKSLVYKGTVSNVELKKGASNTVTVGVMFQQTGDGVLVISKDVAILSNKAETTVKANFATVKKEGSSDSETSYVLANLSENGVSLPSGKYRVTLYCTQNPEGASENERGIVYAQGAIIVNVYDNIRTTVEGTINESTTDLGFAAKDDTDLEHDFTVIEDGQV